MDELAHTSVRIPLIMLLIVLWYEKGEGYNPRKVAWPRVATL